MALSHHQAQPDPSAPSSITLLGHGTVTPPGVTPQHPALSRCWAQPKAARGDLGALLTACVAFLSVFPRE